MQSLIDLLSHPHLVLNRVAEQVYEGEGNATHQRLRSRVSGRHRFTSDEYQAIRKTALGVSRRLDSIATKIDDALASGQPKDWLQLVAHPWLNHKSLLAEAGAPLGMDYLRSYDALRGQRPLPEAYLPSLANTYRDFAAWIRAQLDLAKVERKAYPFSQGRGGASHRKA
jgi:hypothetical protein